MTYSTCSLNPIENEAVIAALLKEFKNKIRILKVELPNFKFHPGLTSWRTMHNKPFAETKDLKEGESYF